MNTSILVEAGLTEAQATAYTAMLTHSPISPPALARVICETRTNAYKILEQLDELGLVSRDESKKKIQYFSNSPKALQALLDQQEKEIKLRQKKLKSNIAELEKVYFEHSTQPGVSFEQGTDGIIKVFNDYTETGKDLYLIRSWKDKDYMGKGVLSVWRKKPSTKGITTHILGPDTESASSGEIDELYLIDKTWMKEEDYTSPVEWCAYGDKLAIISYGKEASATTIHSPQIAEGFKQLHRLLTTKQRQSKDYDRLPTKARLSDDPTVMQTKEYKSVVKKRHEYIKKHKLAKKSIRN
jgi:sugar-specific transcriptional regulator TrmB